MEDDEGTGREGGRILLLTGRPGVGKTTALRRVADRLAGFRVGGFYTEEMREGGRRVGFRGIPFDATEGTGIPPSGGRTIAHVEIPGPPRVSRYGVDVEAVDDLARRTLGPDPEVDLHLLDEIGKMECLSKVFVTRVRALLDGDRPLVATVGRSGTGLIRDVKEHPEAVLRTVTKENRDALPDRVVGRLRGRTGGGQPPG